VLEQRIGRIHRLGQHRPVRVIDFIAQGTIEHGMLALLDFKRSLFAGVLDGGANEVFLGGSRLKRFMESVEKVTDAIPPGMPAEEAVAAAEEAVAETMEGPAAPPAPPAEPAWSELITAGLSLLNKVSRDLAPAGQGPSPAALVGSMVHTDESGRTYLKLPVPKPDTLKKIADLLYELAGGK